jgi:endonuclease-3
MEIQEALRWLESLKGVGPKTAACVLLFSWNKPVFPVDTHIHRVSKRLGLIGERTTREEAHRVLGELVPPEATYDFHLNMIAHGRQVCQARTPRCEICALREHCDYYQERVLPYIP